METCKAAIFTNISGIEYGQIPFPCLESEDDAILRVIVSGICGSDLHPYHGREACAFGTAFGHECVGEVISLGNNVTNFVIGDIVAVPFSVACGKCFYCNEKMSARCKHSQLLGWKDNNGKGIHGTQSEYVRVPQASGSLYKISNSNITPEEGLLLGDILSTAIYATSQAGIAGWHSSGSSVRAAEHLMNNIQFTHSQPYNQFNEVFAVIGCGPVGLLVVVVIRAFLLWRGVDLNDILIYAIDTVPERLSAAQRWGATPLQLHLNDNNLSQDNIYSEICQQSLRRGRSGDGVDAVIECVGNSSAITLAYKILSPGGILSSIGVNTSLFPITPSDIYDKNVTYRSGRCPSRSVMTVSDYLLQWYKNKEMRVGTKGEELENVYLTDIITHRMKLSDVCTAYEIFDKKLEGCLKAVLYPNEIPSNGKKEERREEKEEEEVR